MPEPIPYLTRDNNTLTSEFDFKVKVSFFLTVSSFFLIFWVSLILFIWSSVAPNCLTLNEIILKKVSVSINDRLIERKDRGYFHNCKMFNKKNDFLLLVVALIY